MTFTDDKPIFIQLAEMLEDAVLSGAYAEEQQIPSITEFSVACKINPATALKGVNILVEAGLIYKKRGLGMFVCHGARKKIISQRKETFYHTFIQPMIGEAQQLSISRQELIEMTERGYQEYVD